MNRVAAAMDSTRKILCFLTSKAQFLIDTQNISMILKDEHDAGAYVFVICRETGAMLSPTGPSPERN